MKMNTWKSLAVSSLVALLFFIGLPEAKADESREHIDVYKTPTCGCCVDWIKHIEEKDFITAVFHPENINELKRQKGIKPQYQSCHTGISKEGYIFEGHIPARFIKEYLENPIPGSIGLSVPGMPVGSPGMEVGDKFLPYRILALMKDGSVEIYKAIDSMEGQYNPDQKVSSTTATKKRLKTTSR